MTLRRFEVDVVTDSGGDAEVYSHHFSGKIVSIRYVKNDFANGVDFVITSANRGETIWSEENVNASATRYPRAPTHGSTGAAAAYASGGEAVNTKIAFDQDQAKIVVAAGGDTKSGTFHITVDD